MKILKQQLLENMEIREIIDYNPRHVFPKERYQYPHKFSFITLDEFCELNGFIEEELTDNQINLFYKWYGCYPFGVNSVYESTHDHNAWIIENLQSHDHETVIRRISKTLKEYLISYDTTETSEKHTYARIIKLHLDPLCDIVNKQSEKTFKLTDTRLGKNIQDRLSQLLCHIN